MTKPSVSFWDRFYSKCIPEPNTGCWIWIGGMNGSRSPHGGYGQMRYIGKIGSVSV